jgi:hypothetical protein
VAGLPREEGPKKLTPAGDKKWIPDGKSGDVFFEDKFGVHARLSPGQKAAQAELGPNFRLYHFLPADIGKFASAEAGAFAAWMRGDGGAENPRR